MFLIVTHADDVLALRAHGALRERHGAARVRLLTGDELALSARWSLRQDGAHTSTRLRLQDGAEISSADTRAVFNRLRYTGVPQFASANEADREYAVMEMHAFLLSWLAGLDCPVVNRASPRGLGGAERGAAEWLLLAGRAGLPTREMRFTTSARRFPKPGYDSFVPVAGGGAGLSSASPAPRPTPRAILGKSPAHFLEPLADGGDGDCWRRILVVGDTAHDGGTHDGGGSGDELPASLKEDCVRLARAADCTLVEFWFARSKTGAARAHTDWRFCGANPRPSNLRDDEFDSLIALLETGEQVRTACGSGRA